MNEMSINIPLSVLGTFDEVVQKAILSALAHGTGSSGRMPVPAQPQQGRDETGVAALNVQEAKLFLNNCSAKSRHILQAIVDRNGDLMGSDITALVGGDLANLRGAWAGLTKRLRTVTKDPEAKLLNWFKQGDDWHVIMAAQTVASMRLALAERG